MRSSEFAIRAGDMPRLDCLLLFDARRRPLTSSALLHTTSPPQASGTLSQPRLAIAHQRSPWALVRHQRNKAAIHAGLRGRCTTCLFRARPDRPRRDNRALRRRPHATHHAYRPKAAFSLGHLTKYRSSPRPARQQGAASPRSDSARLFLHIGEPHDDAAASLVCRP